MDIKIPSHNEFLNFQIQRHIIQMAKDCLIILEEFKDDGFLNEEGYGRLRKKILSSSNDKIRDMKAIIDQFDIELRKT